MQAEDRLHMEGIEQTVAAEIFGAAGTFLAGLEDQQHIFGEAFFLVQPPGQLQDDGHVAVVAAGVHPAGVAGGKRGAGVLFDGQGVAIGPEGDGAALTEIKIGAEGTLHGREEAAFEPGQGIVQVFHGFRQGQFQLGNLVQGPSVVNDLHAITSGQ